MVDSRSDSFVVRVGISGTITTSASEVVACNDVECTDSFNYVDKFEINDICCCCQNQMTISASIFSRAQSTPTHACTFADVRGATLCYDV